MRRDGTGAHGETDLDRRVVPDERDVERAHARGRDPDLRGPAAGVRRLPRPRPQPAASGASLPPEARFPAGRDRQALLGRRPQLQPRLPRSPLGPAGAGLRGATAQPHGTDLLAGARPLEAALGALAGPGAREEPVRAGHQDAPRPRRRGRGCRHRHGPVRPEAGAGADRAGSRLGAAASTVLRRARRTRAGRAQRDPVQADPPRPQSRHRSGEDHPPGGRGRRGARRGGLELHQPRPRHRP